jgi:hypothetical protein
MHEQCESRAAGVSKVGPVLVPDGDNPEHFTGNPPHHGSGYAVLDPVPLPELAFLTLTSVDTAHHLCAGCLCHWLLLLLLLHLLYTSLLSAKQPTPYVM